MFYGTFVLAKKGPLAKVWLAAHWDKKLTKAHVFETDVESTVDSIISPEVKMALRTSGHLLLGVVRIYYRKQKYLISDLGEACAKIRMAFRPGIVDLPAEGGVASTDAITLPEIFHDFETAISDIGTLDMEEQFTVNPSRVSEITMQDDVATTSGGMFDEYGPGFEDFGGGMEDIEVHRKTFTDDQSRAEASTSRLETDSTANGITLQEDDKGRPSDFTLDNQLPDRGDFGGEFGGDFLEGGFGFDGGLDLGGMPNMSDITLGEGAQRESGEKETPMEVDQAPQEKTAEDNDLSGADMTVIPVGEEGFVLEPVEVGVKEKPKKRKRKLVVDTDKELTAAEIKAQLMDCSDTIQQKCFPPPTKKALVWKDNASCEQLFLKPTQSFLIGTLSKTVTRNYFTGDIPGELQDETLIDLDHDISKMTDIETQRNATVTGDAMAAETTTETMGDLSAAATRDESHFQDNFGMTDDMRPFDLDGGDMGENLEDGSTTRVIPDMPDLSGQDDAENQDTLEQQSGEQANEFEQRRWTKRTQQVFHMIDRVLTKSETVKFSSLTPKCSRKQAASRFYTCLLLTKEGTIAVDQKEAYGEIEIRKGARYTEAF